MAATVTCLIVDDLAENLLALAALLAEPDVEILQARSGAEALELLLVHTVALAILDVQMPELDGFELAELMRGSERTRHIPIIFVTAGVGDDRRMFKGYESGAVDFLHKPIESHVLKSKARIFFQLQRQKLQLADDLRQRTETLRMNELFMAMLGHDLRGPLSAIVMATTLLERKAGDERMRQVAGRALTSAKSMSRMIEDILDLARARVGGGISVRRVPCDLEAAIRHVVEERRATAPGHDFRWVAEGDFAGDWDTDRLAQVASNLLGNTVRHGVEGAPVDVRLDGRAADAVVLTVANAGRIEPEVLPHLFDPFRGRDEHAGRNGGLGIGLYIVQQIVAAHGGTVEASSSEDRTEFRVRLPRRATPPH